MSIPLFLLVMILRTTQQMDTSSCNMTSNKDALPVGEKLVIKCKWKYQKSGSDLKFVWQNNIENMDNYTENLNSTARQVIYDTTRLAGQTQVICTRNGSVGCGKTILVGYPPVPPENIVCVCYNLRKMICRWDQVKTEDDLKIPTNWTAVYSIGQSSVFVLCPETKSAASCEWPEYDFRPGFKYNMYIQSNNSLSTASSSAIVINPSLKVKPDSVLIYEKTIKARALSFKVGMPDTLYPIIPSLEYRIEYTCTTCNPLNRTSLPGKHPSNGWKEVTLTSLLPHSSYNISVWIKPDNSGFWSDESQFTAYTEQDVPDASPTIAAVTRSSIHTSRITIDIYWLPIDGVLRNGDVTGYELILSWGNERRTVNVSSLYPPITVEDLDADVTYRLKMSAYTKIGRGPFSNVWELNGSNQDIGKITDVWAETFYNGSGQTTTRLYWIPPKTADVSSYHVYRCLGQSHRPLDTFVADCEDELKVYDVRSTGLETNTTIIFDMKLDDPSNSVLGVSATSSDGITSNVAWAECVSSRGKDLSQIQDVKVLHNDTVSLSIGWDVMSCEVIVDKFQVSYWPISDNFINSCEQGIKQEFTLGRKAKKLSIQHLKESSRYALCVRAISTTGHPGPWSKSVEGETTTPLPVLEITLGASLFVTAVVALGIILWIKRKVREKMEIKVPPTVADKSRETKTYNSEPESYEKIDDTCQPHSNLLVMSPVESPSPIDEDFLTNILTEGVHGDGELDGCCDSADMSIARLIDSADLPSKPNQTKESQTLSAIINTTSADDRNLDLEMEHDTLDGTSNTATPGYLRRTTDVVIPSLNLIDISPSYVSTCLISIQHGDESLPCQGSGVHCQLQHDANGERRLGIGLSHGGTGSRNTPRSSSPDGSPVVIQESAANLSHVPQEIHNERNSEESERRPDQNTNPYVIITNREDSLQSSRIKTTVVSGCSRIDGRPVAVRSTSVPVSEDTNVTSGYSRFGIDGGPAYVHVPVSSNSVQLSEDTNVTSGYSRFGIDCRPAYVPVRSTSVSVSEDTTVTSGYSHFSIDGRPAYLPVPSNSAPLIEDTNVTSGYSRFGIDGRPSYVPVPTTLVSASEDTTVTSGYSRFSIDGGPAYVPVSSTSVPVSEDTNVTSGYSRFSIDGGPAYVPVPSNSVPVSEDTNVTSGYSRFGIDGRPAYVPVPTTLVSASEDTTVTSGYSRFSIDGGPAYVPVSSTSVPVSEDTNVTSGYSRFSIDGGPAYVPVPVPSNSVPVSEDTNVTSGYSPFSIYGRPAYVPVPSSSVPVSEDTTVTSGYSRFGIDGRPAYVPVPTTLVSASEDTTVTSGYSRFGIDGGPTYVPVSSTSVPVSEDTNVTSVTYVTHVTSGYSRFNIGGRPAYVPVSSTSVPVSEDTTVTSGYSHLCNDGRPAYAPAPHISVPVTIGITPYLAQPPAIPYSEVVSGTERTHVHFSLNAVEV